MSIMIIPAVPLFIGGQFRETSSNATYDVYNPATGEVIEHTAAASPEDWRSNHGNLPPPAAKAAMFRKAAQLIITDKYAKRIVQLVVDETGCVESLARYGNVAVCASYLNEACDMAYSVKGEILPSDSGAQCFVQKIPMGVILVISPWNSQLGLSLMTCLPPIAAGNTVVLKTPEHSPAAQLVTAELLKEAGLPDGVLNVIHTAREDSGPRVAEIIAEPAIRKIGFTGSGRVGRIIAAEAAKHLKPCVFELGCKAPSVVLNDANIDAAARAIISGAYVHSGQMCVGTERVIVQREVSQALIERLKSIASKMKAGDQSKGDAKLSCVFSPSSAANIISMIQEAVSEGAELVLGDMKADGAFVQPHIVLGAKPGQRMWDRESFGPVFTISIVDTVDEAIELANSTTYTLTSALWTYDMQLAFKVSRRMRAGKNIVNGTTYAQDKRFDKGGWGGSSGYGTFAIESFLNTQLISFQSPESQKAYILADF